MSALGAPAELGSLLPPLTGRGAWRRLRATAERAVGAGAASVWVPDVGDPVPVLSALSRLVGVRLGLFGARPGRRPLTVLAKELAGLDVISHGRLEVAVGETSADPGPIGPTGSAGPAAAVEPADVAESLEVLGGLMAGGPFVWTGRLASARQARCLPPAVQAPHPPLWVVGAASGLVQVAARSADAWMAAAADPRSYAGLAEEVDSACEGLGRDPAGLRRGVVLPPGPPPSPAALEAWAEIGVGLVLAAPPP